MEDVYKQDFSVRKVLGEIIGVSPAMVRLRRAIRKIARTRENVLLIGESGVGKRFFAQKIHLLGPNKHQPFVEIDCSLVYSHFSNGKELKFEEFISEKMLDAVHGTLAFYRIESLTPSQQVQILRCLSASNGQLNGNAESSPRIVATTELDTKSAIGKKRIDAKLYYLLGEILITVPPLRNRKQDIPYLFQHFVEDLQKSEGDEAFAGLSDDLYDSMMSYEWQGNVEELQNSTRTLVLTADDGESIPEALPFIKDNDPFKALIGKPLPDAIAQVERYLMKVALGKFEGNQTKAAQYLKISEASLRYKLKKYKITNK
ncbi:MAG: sigma-54-dependent Fis family transcriptional regulator [Deferribacteres bacterium]|nr:sigma-54-dependent Fis family transcriptional regulator [candidate division KSB1 bacterium]MCB9512551.1 sigma-54-dependent Fis family transcriptional regulator [Deferribacteres bacterium]